MKKLYTRPIFQSYTTHELYEIAGPVQASYSVDLWFQQVSSDYAMLNGKSEDIQTVAKMQEQKIYRYYTLV